MTWRVFDRSYSEYPCEFQEVMDELARAWDS